MKSFSPGNKVSVSSDDLDGSISLGGMNFLERELMENGGAPELETFGRRKSRDRNAGTFFTDSEETCLLRYQWFLTPSIRKKVAKNQLYIAKLSSFLERVDTDTSTLYNLFSTTTWELGIRPYAFEMHRNYTIHYHHSSLDYLCERWKDANEEERDNLKVVFIIRVYPAKKLYHCLVTLMGDKTVESKACYKQFPVAVAVAPETLEAPEND